MLITEKALREIVMKSLLSEGLLGFLGSAGADVAQGEIIKSATLEKISEVEADICNYLAENLGIKGKSDLTEVGKDWGPINGFDCTKYREMISKIKEHNFTDHVLSQDIALVGIHQLYELVYKGDESVSREILAQNEAYSVAYDFCDILNLILSLYKAQNINVKDVVTTLGLSLLQGPAGIGGAGYGLFMDFIVTPEARKGTIAGIIAYQAKSEILKQRRSYLKKIKSANKFLNTLNDANKKKYNCKTIPQIIKAVNKENLDNLKLVLSKGIAVQFDFKSAILQSASKKKLDVFIGYFKKMIESNPSVGTTKVIRDFPIYILGFASAEGTSKLNDSLSEERAQSVAEYINKKYKSAKIGEITGVGAIRKKTDVREADRRVFVTLNKSEFDKKAKEAEKLKMIATQKKIS